MFSSCKWCRDVFRDRCIAGDKPVDGVDRNAVKLKKYRRSY